MGVARLGVDGAAGRNGEDDGAAGIEQLPDLEGELEQLRIRDVHGHGQSNNRIEPLPEQCGVRWQWECGRQ